MPFSQQQYSSLLTFCDDFERSSLDDQHFSGSRRQSINMDDGWDGLYPHVFHQPPTPDGSQLLDPLPLELSGLNIHNGGAEAGATWSASPIPAQNGACPHGLLWSFCPGIRVSASTSAPHSPATSWASAISSPRSLQWESPPPSPGSFYLIDNFNSPSLSTSLSDTMNSPGSRLLAPPTNGSPLAPMPVHGYPLSPYVSSASSPSSLRPSSSNGRIQLTSFYPHFPDTSASSTNSVLLTPDSLLTTEPVRAKVGTLNMTLAGITRRKSAKKEAKHVCPFSYCSKAFTERHNLKYHINCHLNLNPFPCIFCPRAFKNKADLKRHQKKNQMCKSRQRGVPDAT